MLLNALIHDFAQMNKIASFVFDEIHHCVRDHFANKIIQNFYHANRQKKQEKFSNILKLTINSIIRKKKKKIAINVCKNVILSQLSQIKIIEQNFNVVNKTSKLDREKLRKYVRKLKMTVLIHFEDEISSSLFFLNLTQLYLNLDIEQNFYVIYFRNKNTNKYLKMRTSRKTYCKIK